MSFYASDDRYADDVHYRGGCVLAMEMLHWATCDARLQRDAARPTVRRGRVARAVARAASSGRRPSSSPGSPTSAATTTGSTVRSARTTRRSAAPCTRSAAGRTATRMRCCACSKDLPVPRKGLIGPWGHNDPVHGIPGPAVGILQEQVRWWDRWLKGVDNGIDREPMLRCGFRTGWRRQPSWPTDPAHGRSRRNGRRPASSSATRSSGTKTWS